MDVGVYSYPSSDPVLIDKIVHEFLSQGKFDKLRKECMADADTKPAYQNLQQRVESTVSQFLRKQVWKPDLNKNQLRDALRKHILESGLLDAGINRIVDQIVNPNVLATVFMPEVEEVVYSYLSIPRPGDKSVKNCDSSVKAYSNSKVNQNQSGSEGKDDRDNKYQEFKLNNSEKIKNEEIGDRNGTGNKNDSPHDVQIMHIEKEEQTRLKIEVEDMESSQCYATKDDCKMEVLQEDNSVPKLLPEKIELPSDDSQESLSRMGVERLRISESDGINAPDSDASVPLEINEKTMSDSRDSEDFIMNKMSPISQGRLTPEDMCIEEEEKKEEKEKRPLSFIGRIPKIKRDDSETKKVEEPAKTMVKSVASSDESDSSKHSFSKSDSEDKKKKEAKYERDKGEKKYKEYDKKDDDKKRKSDHHRGSDGRSRRDDKSRSRRDDKDKSHSRSRDDKRDKGDKKSSSSSSSSHSRSKSSSHHRSGHKSGNHGKEHHRDDSRSRDRSRHDRKDRDKRDIDRRKKEDEKRKKSKTVDDHGKERNRRDDRRSTDRDSNERERDKSKDGGSGRMQSDGKKKEKDHKDDARKEKNQKEENDMNDSEAVQTVKKEKVEEEVVETVKKEATANIFTPKPEVMDVKTLAEQGAVTRVYFPNVIDDFYVKFDSTGFRYFEDWETTKLDCEEEFKEYIDEAEKDLSLLSDDGSEYEPYGEHAASEEKKREVIADSVRGIGNFVESLIFDPVTYEFYKWKDVKHYWKCRGKEVEEGATEARHREVEEECQAEKNKENRDRSMIRKNLKFLNRYHRKVGFTLKRGREQHKFVRRKKKMDVMMIRERNFEPLKENQTSEIVQEESSRLETDGPVARNEDVSNSAVPKMDVDAKIRLYQIQSMRRLKPEACQTKTGILARITSGGKQEMMDDEEENENDEDVAQADNITKKVKKRGIRIGLSRPRPKADFELDVHRKINENFSLPLSPESDDSTFNNNGTLLTKKAQRKRSGDYADISSVKKDCKRVLNQKYESQDLYKPRPFSHGSKSRGKTARDEDGNFDKMDAAEK